MHNEYKHQSPYRGFVVIILLLTVPTLLCYAIVDAVVTEYSRWPEPLNRATVQAFGCGFGCMFHFIALLCGLLTPGWEALKFRVGDFFENLVVGVGYAFKSYLENMVTDGVTFLIYFSIMACNFYFLVDGVRDALALIK